MPDNCKACNDLREEAGELFPLYARKLLLKGWGGTYSPVERAYIRAHRPLSEAQRGALEKAYKASPLAGFTAHRKAEADDAR